MDGWKGEQTYDILYIVGLSSFWCFRSVCMITILHNYNANVDFKAASDSTNKEKKWWSSLLWLSTAYNYYGHFSFPLGWTCSHFFSELWQMMPTVAMQTHLSQSVSPQPITVTVPWPMFTHQLLQFLLLNLPFFLSSESLIFFKIVYPCWLNMLLSTIMTMGGSSIVVCRGLQNGDNVLTFIQSLTIFALGTEGNVELFW